MRILLVEDDPEVLNYFAQALRRLRPDLEIVEASNGREAFDYFLNMPFDLVLSDQRMPQMSGLDLLRAVRNHSNIPFVLFSSDRHAEEEALDYGVSEYLSKPIGMFVLGSVLGRYL
ncbi:MAG: response regulator [Candidatus Viridilinea halotolerans]|uniref:Response regulator n=1 Tax=Candidatus Viridilinea halotolerans TaxID=2491704 RepID=A0A426U1R2_9CHLR|nr:MAG: response regulator [Candidatus Viridilinea halotolerans]